MDVLQRMGPMREPRTAVAPVELCAMATTENAAMMRRRFRSWVGALTDPDTADDLALAVYEALANVVDHAYVDRSAPGLMTLWAVVSRPLLTGRDLVVTVLDEGAWRPSNGPGWRGRGLPLMRELMHATTVLSDDDGTTVQLRRRIAPATSSAAAPTGASSRPEHGRATASAMA
jgi:serine/threonine-protein kinase RsbW